MDNGLRQGCTIAPVLFNLFMCAVMERWHRLIDGDGDIGLRILQYRQDTLFPTRLKPTLTIQATECQFADDGALLATTRNGAGRALGLFIKAAAEFGLRVNTSKTKFMAVGVGVSETDSEPLPTSFGPVASVSPDSWRISSLIDVWSLSVTM